jgi:hypothetical protein
MRLLVNFMRWAVLGIITSWLLFLAFWIWLLQFHQYSNLAIIDCDSDVESLLLICFALLWGTTLAIWAINLILKYRYKNTSFCFIGILSAFLSVILLPKFVGLMQYNAELVSKCP